MVDCTKFPKHFVIFSNFFIVVYSAKYSNKDLRIKCAKRKIDKYAHICSIEVRLKISRLNDLNELIIQSYIE
jgi:hypothetical protein